MSQRDIEDNLREIYGAEVSQTLVSKITDKILPEVNEWQNRPLETICPIIYFDGIVFRSRKDSQMISKCVYSVLGIDMNGQKEIVGIWTSGNEGASFYASICSDPKKRGVTDIFIACHGNLKGLETPYTRCSPRRNSSFALFIKSAIPRNLCATPTGRKSALTSRKSMARFILTTRSMLKKSSGKNGIRNTRRFCVPRTRIGRDSPRFLSFPGKFGT
jgi:hypothetical protein